MQQAVNPSRKTLSPLRIWLGRNRSGSLAYFVYFFILVCEGEKTLLSSGANLAPSRVGLCSLCHFTFFTEVVAKFSILKACCGMIDVKPRFLQTGKSVIFPIIDHILFLLFS